MIDLAASTHVTISAIVGFMKKAIISGSTKERVGDFVATFWGKTHTMQFKNLGAKLTTS